MAQLPQHSLDFFLKFICQYQHSFWLFDHSCISSLLQEPKGSRSILFFEILTYLIFFRYWISVGAQPSDPVQRILFRAGLLPPPPMVAMGLKGGARDRRPIDPLSGRYPIPKQPSKAIEGTEAVKIEDLKA